MASTMTYTGTLMIMECSNCHIAYAVPIDFNQRCRDKGDTFYCPRGHSQVYRTSELDKLRSQLATAQRHWDWAETARKAAEDQAQTAEYRRRAAAGQVTKIRKRIANGVCPCCNRTFSDLAAHMETKHPGYGEVPPVA